MSIETVIFDVGNVLFHYDPVHILNRLIPDKTHHTLYLEQLFNHHIWQDLDRGDLTQDRALDQLATHLGDAHRENLTTCLTYFVDHLETISHSKELFISLKKKYPVYILSNFQDKPFDRLLDLHPFLNLADGMIVSAKVNRMKPEPEIYQHLLDTYKLNPNTAVFIDDRPENIEAANHFGIAGIVYQNPEQLERDLHL